MEKKSLAEYCDELSTFYKEYANNSAGIDYMKKLAARNFQDVKRRGVKEITALQEELDMLKIITFAIVRNNFVAPIGYAKKKSEQEITDKVFETIEEMKKQIDIQVQISRINLASDTKNRIKQ